MAYFETIFFLNGLFSAHGQGPPPWIKKIVCLAMAGHGHDKKSWKAYGEAAGGGGGQAVGGGPGGSDRIGADLTKIDLWLKNIVFGQFLTLFDHFWTF